MSVLKGAAQEEDGQEMTEKKNAPLSDVLGTVGLIAGFIAGCNTSHGSFIVAFVVAIVGRVLSASTWGIWRGGCSLSWRAWYTMP